MSIAIEQGKLTGSAVGEETDRCELFILSGTILGPALTVMAEAMLHHGASNLCVGLAVIEAVRRSILDELSADCSPEEAVKLRQGATELFRDVLMDAFKDWVYEESTEMDGGR